jgi:hypothetical protein
LRYSVEHNTQFVRSETQMVGPLPKPPVVCDGATPAFCRGLLDHRITDLTLDLYDQVIAARENYDEIGEILPRDAILSIGDD